MPCSIATPANTAVNALLVNENLDLPTIDLNGFTIPDFVGLPTDLPSIDQIDLGQLTDGKVCGTGMFDRLMVSVDAHLANQFQKNRITGDAYARTYTELIQSTMANAVQFLLTKDQSYWTGIAAQQSAYMANAQLARATIEAKTAVAQLAMVMAQMKNERATFALTKAKVATEEAAYCTAQLNLTDVMPAQINNITLEGQLVKANTDIAVYNHTEILPAQKTQLTAQTAGVTAQTTHLTTKEGPKVTQETTNLTTTNLMLQEQIKLIKEQTESQRANTLDTRLDGATVSGTIGKQKLLQQQQIDSYKRDQEYKYLKILTDAWVTQKTMDEALTPPTSFTNASIDTVMSKYRTNTALS